MTEMQKQTDSKDRISCQAEAFVLSYLIVISVNFTHFAFLVCAQL